MAPVDVVDGEYDRARGRGFQQQRWKKEERDNARVAAEKARAANKGLFWS
jgi:hypothetical protein